MTLHGDRTYTLLDDIIRKYQSREDFWKTWSSFTTPMNWCLLFNDCSWEATTRRRNKQAASVNIRQRFSCHIGLHMAVYFPLMGLLKDKWLTSRYDALTDVGLTMFIYFPLKLLLMSPYTDKCTVDITQLFWGTPPTPHPILLDRRAALNSMLYLN